MSRKLSVSVRFLLLLLFVLGFFQRGNPAYSAEQAPLALCAEGTPRIMPLGDSITRGSSSGIDDATLQVGFRKYLYDSLVSEFGDVNFVGSLINGENVPDFDPNHEGHAGWTAAQVATNIYNWLDSLGTDWPHIILLHIGTNGTSTPSEKAAQVGDILDEIDRFENDNTSPITVILALIIDHEDHDQQVSDFNDLVATMAQSRIDSLGDDIVIVDMENGAEINYELYTFGGDFYDPLHPWETGYKRMAAVWQTAVVNILAGCNNQPHITNPPDDRTDAEGSSPALDIDATDADGDQTLTYSATNIPPGLIINGSTGVISGMIDYSAAENSPYNVVVTVTDNGFPSRHDTAPFTWTVTNTNRPPSVSVDEYLATEDQALNVLAPGVLVNDSDPDGDSISAALVSPPGHGNLALNGNGAFLYTPYTDYFGPDSFTYKASDGTADSNVAAVNITIGGMKDPPKVTPPGDQQDREGEAVTLQIVASDVDGDALSFSIAGQPPNLQIDPDTGLIAGILTYQSSTDSPYSVTVIVSDGTLNSEIVFTWTILEAPRLFLPMITVSR